MPQTWRELSGGGARDEHEIFKSRQLQSRSLCAIAFTSSSSPCCISHSHTSVRVNQRVMSAVEMIPLMIPLFSLPHHSSRSFCRVLLLPAGKSKLSTFLSHKISDMLKLSVTQGRHTSSHPPLNLSVSLCPPAAWQPEREQGPYLAQLSL